jgi:cysteinyl-tRNA synthetase
MNDNIFNVFNNFYNDIEKRLKNASFDDKNLNKDLLNICNLYRENYFLENGFKINQSCFDKNTWNLLSEEEVDDFLKNKKEEQEKLRIIHLKQQEEQEKLERIRASIHPDDMFIIEKSKYSKYDENGFPTHDFNGKLLTNKCLNKLYHEQEEQRKLYEKYH